MKRFVPIFLLPFLLMAGVRWETTETEHLRVVYPEGYQNQAQHAARWIETERDGINKLTGWEPRKTWVVLEDVGMGVNGFANPVGNEIHLYTTPPSGYRLATQDWLRTVGIHEYVHISSLQPVYGFPKILKALFGPWVLPNALVPGWMIEGVTVYYESQLAPYEGRLENGFFDANLLTRAAQGDFPSTWEMNGSLTRFPFGQIYAYGGPFFEWLMDEKGQETASRFYNRNGRNIPIFFIDGAAKKSFGDRFPGLLSDWEAATRARALTFVPADSAATRLTHTGWYIQDMSSDEGKVYYVRRRYLKRAALYTSGYTEIVRLDPSTGEEKVLLRPNTSVKELKVCEGTIYYSVSDYERGFANTYNQGFGEVYRLCSYHLETGRREKIFQGRIRSFERLPQGSFLVSLDRPTKTGSRLVEVNRKGEQISELYSGNLLVDEILAADDEIYMTARKQGEHWDIYSFSKVDGSFKNLTSTLWVETGLSLSSSGKLLYSASPDASKGKVGVYLLDPSLATIQRLETPDYALMPVMADDKLIFASLNPQGYDLYSVPIDATETSLPIFPPDTAGVTFWQGGQITYEREFAQKSNLRPYISLLSPWARIPYAWPSFDDAWNLTNLDMGIFLLGADVVGENSYQIAGSYDVLNQTPDFNLYWQNQRFAPLNLNLDLSYAILWDSTETPAGHSWSVYPSFSYPVYYSSGRGLNSIRWGEGFRMRGVSLENRRLITNLGVSFSWPFWRVGVAASHRWESPVFSDGEHSFLYARAAASFDVAGGLLIGDLSNFADLSAQLPQSYVHSGPIRGYEELRTEEPLFFTSTVEYRHRLFKMRFGLWNPNVFFEDLYLRVYADAGFDSRSILGASTGLELSPEVHLVWGMLRLAPVAGVSLNLEGEVNFHWEVTTWLPFQITKSTKDAAEFARKPWLADVHGQKTPAR